MKKLLCLLFVVIPFFCFSQSNKLKRQFNEISANQAFIFLNDIEEGLYSNLILNKSIERILSNANKFGYELITNKSKGGIIFYRGNENEIILMKTIRCYKCIDAPRYALGLVVKSIFFSGDSIKEGIVTKIITESMYSHTMDAPVWSDYFQLVANEIRTRFDQTYNFESQSKEYGIKSFPYRTAENTNFYDVVSVDNLSKKNNSAVKLKLTFSERKKRERSSNGRFLNYSYLRHSLESTNFDNIKSDIIEKTISKNKNLNSLRFTVGGVDLRKINEYDLEAMVEYFLNDCKKNNINVPDIKTLDATFVPQEGDVLALAYGFQDDNVIKIQIDPEKWAKSSSQKRWYVLYHELGHDVLNLEHGQGGKMMFNFVDRNYTWDEFFNDKQYMFNFLNK